MFKVLSLLKAFKSYALGVRLKQTYSIFHSHAKAIISPSFKDFNLFCWFWDSKLLLSLSMYKINYPSKYNLLLVRYTLILHTF